MTLWEAMPLPRGRHGIPREDVVAVQRSRLFTALVHAAAERGYAATPVAEVLRRANVSRETFYQLFTSKLDCFLQCLEETARDFLAALRVQHPAAVELSPRDRFGAVLDRFLGALADDPDRARVLLVEVFAAGPDALATRMDLQARFVDAMVTELGEVDRFACECLLEAISSRVTGLLALDQGESIRTLGPAYVELADRLLFRASAPDGVSPG